MAPTRPLLLALLLLAAPALADDPELQLDKARGYFAEGQYEEAMVCLKRVEGDSPTGVDALRLAARIHRTLGRLDEAAEALGKVLVATPGDIEARVDLAELAWYRGRAAEAVKWVDEVLAADAASPNPGALCLSGNLLEEQGKMDEAMKRWREARDQFFKRELGSARDLYWAGVAARRYGMRTSEERRTEALSLVTERILPAALDKDPALYEARHEMGRIWIDAFDAPYAKENYEEAIKKNKRHPDLLAGLAATKLLNFGTRPEAVPLLEQALQINPRHVEALDLLAAIRLDDEEYEATRALLDRALAVNPEHEESLALLAGYHWLAGDPAAYAEVEKRVLAANPACGHFYYVVSQAILTKRQFHEAVDLLKKAIELDPCHWHAYIELGTNLMRTGVGGEKDALPYLEKAMEEFPYHVQSRNMLALLETYDEYVVRPHGNVTIRLHVSEDALMRPYVERLVDRCVADLTKRYDFEPKGPILLELFHKHDDFAVRSVGLTGLGALGVCFGQVVTMDSPAARNGEFNWHSTAWHEMAHVLTLQRSKYRIPRWFTEGLSGLEEKRANPAWLREQDVPLLAAYTRGQMRGIADLNAGFTRPRYGNEVIVCYYQAALVCEFIEKTYGWDKVLRMIDLYGGERKATPQVLREVLGLDEKRFDEGFSAYMVENYFSRMKFLPSVPREEIEDLRDRVDIDEKDAAAHVRLALAYFESGKIADAEIHTGRALALAPADPIPYLVQGRILYQKKRFAQARASFLKGFELGGDDYPSRIYLGIIFRDVEKDAEKAVREFEKAKAAFPGAIDGSSPYLLLADHFLAEGDTDRAIAELEQFCSLNAEDFERHVQVARLHIDAGRPERAVRLLREATETKIQDPTLHRLLAETERKLGNMEEALLENRALLELEPPEGHHRIYAEMAEIELARGNRDQARLYAEEALKRKADYEPAKKVLEALK
ncbi:MAG: tetratricopeptide repeat protein [Planctomycetes bacterium]|nr:tetratricopeptide repeat protein [Planctomycetota bacterium]